MLVILGKMCAVIDFPTKKKIQPTSVPLCYNPSLEMGNMDYTYNFVIGTSCLNFGT